MASIGAAAAAAVVGAALSLDFLTATASSGTVTSGTTDLTFTRASTARYFDSSGVLQSAASGIARVGTNNRRPVTNLLTYPEQFDNAVWVNKDSSESSGQSDPLGTTRAFKIIEGSTAGTQHGLQYKTFTRPSDGVYTLSAYVKAGERTHCLLTFNALGSVIFNLTTGAVSTVVSAPDSYGIAEVPEYPGWYRIWITDTLASNPWLLIYASSGPNSGDQTYDGDGSSGLYIYGAMLNEGGIEDYVSGGTNLQSNDKALDSWPRGGSTATANTDVAPDGTTTADTMTADASAGGTTPFMYQNVTLTEAGYYWVSAFVKAGTNSWVGLTDNSSFSGGTFGLSTWDVTNGTVGTSASVDSQMTYYGNGWWRVAARVLVVAGDLAGQVRWHVAEGNNDIVWASTAGTETLKFWGMCIQKTTQTAPLLPYPGMAQTGFVKAGYTAEAAATNLVTDSEDFSAASWTINNTNSLTVTTNQAAAVDGNTTADRIEITDTTSETKLISDSITISSNTNYAISAFVQADQQQYVGINLFISSENFATVVFDVIAGKVVATDTGTTSGTVTASGVINCGGGIFRIWAALKVTGTASTIGLAFYNSSSPTFDASGLEAYVGTATDGCFAWGMQVETGTYPASYIATSGGTGSRSKDNLAQGDALGAWFSNTAGTFIVDATASNTGLAGGDYIFGLQSSASINDRLRVTHSNINTEWAPDIATGGVAQETFSAYSVPRGTRAKIALAYAADDLGCSLNGSTAQTDASATIPTLEVWLPIGGGYGSSNEGLYVRSLAYYAARRSDATLAIDSTITDDGTAWIDGQLAA